MKFSVFFFCSQPSICGGNRLRRQADNSQVGDNSEGTPATIEVYSGLYVNEANDLSKAGLDDDSVFSEKVSAVSAQTHKYKHAPRRYVSLGTQRRMLSILYAVLIKTRARATALHNFTLPYKFHHLLLYAQQCTLNSDNCKHFASL